MQTKSDFYNTKAKEYKTENNESSLRYKKALQLAKITDKSKVLDIGCKDAALKRLCESQSFDIEYFGMDISAEVLNRFSLTDNKHFMVGDAGKKIPFPDNTFNFIFALEIIEHVESPTAMLKEIHRVLKADGKFILSLPNPYFYIEMLANFKKKSDTEGHISSFTFQNIMRLLQFAGMKITDSCGTYTRLPFSSRFRNDRQYTIVSTNMFFLTRSYIFRTEIIP